jgi:hypothetical protein
VIKSRKISHAAHIMCMGEARNAHRIWVEKLREEAAGET